jgi:hypothetical protein
MHLGKHNGHGDRENVARPQGTEQHVGTTAKEVAEHASAITRLELELAALELKRKALGLAVGTGLALTAAVLGVFALAFACATVAAGIATALPWWAALLIVTGGLLLFAALLGLLAMGRFRSATPPIPDRAIKQAKLTREAIGN